MSFPGDTCVGDQKAWKLAGVVTDGSFGRDDIIRFIGMSSSNGRNPGYLRILSRLGRRFDC